jgi:hypothetical protein
MKSRPVLIGMILVIIAVIGTSSGCTTLIPGGHFSMLQAIKESMPTGQNDYGDDTYGYEDVTGDESPLEAGDGGDGGGAGGCG